MNPEEVMALLNYPNRDAFMRMARATGLPRVRINRRVIRFDRDTVQRWIRRRSV